MLTTGLNTLSFDVNVSGTANPPTVRCLFGDSDVRMLQAKSLGGSKYSVDVNISEEAGSVVPFKIEVLLNGRIFTPLAKGLEVVSVTAAEPVKVDVLQQVVPEAEVKPAEPEAIVDEPKVAPVVEPVKPVKPLIAQLEEVATKADVKARPSAVQLNKLKNMATAPKTHKPVVKEEVKISLASIAAEHSVPRPKPAAVLETKIIKSDTPVTLKKGDIEYL